MKRLLEISVVVFIVSICCGCASGYIRYKTMGDWQYAAVELPKRQSSLPRKIFAGSAGIMIDGPVLVADTCITPIISLLPAMLGPPALLLGMEDDPFLILSPLFYPWYLCALGGYGGDSGWDMRDLVYREESNRFKE